MRRVIAQWRKEVAQFSRDRLALALALVLPVFQLLMMGQSLSFIVHDMPLVVQDLDGSTLSRELIDRFRGSLTFRVVEWPTDRRPEDALTANAARGVLIIPARFSRALLRGQAADIQLIVDGSDGNTAGLLAAHASGIAAAFNAAHGPARSGGRVEAAVRYWYNPGRVSGRFYGPGIFVMGLSMFPPLLASLAMAREAERKTILQVYVSNISAWEFLAGKVLAFMTVALAEALVLSVFLRFVFGLTFVGDPTPFLVATVLYVFTVAAFGTLIGASAPNQVAAMQAVMMGGFLFTFLLSGLLFPLSNVPVELRWLSYLVWARYYIEVVRDALLQGGGWPAVWWKVLAIAGIGSVFFALAWRRLRPMRLEV